MKTRKVKTKMLMMIASHEDENAYDDRLTEEEWQNLFGTSDDENDFQGF